MVDPDPMRRAITLAAAERPHPNPRVGALVLDAEGRVVGEGAHRGPGQPHAEVIALDQAGSDARGGTLYVTLEPCVHYGRTPPCVGPIRASGVARVVVGAIDPDPRASGAGIAWLQDAGVEVIVSFLTDEVEAMDPAYFHHRRTGRARVTLKLAMTLDGALAAVDGTSRWITSEQARRDAHRLRARADAVVIGAGTLRADDPLLDVRLDQAVDQPVAVVVAGAGPLPGDRRIWERDPLVLTTRARELPSGEAVMVPGEGGRPDPKAAAAALAERGLLELLLEGGSALAGSWWRAGVVDRGVFYIGGRIAGGGGMPALGGRFETMAQSRIVNIDQVRMVGPDIRIEFG